MRYTLGCTVIVVGMLAFVGCEGSSPQGETTDEQIESMVSIAATDYEAENASLSGGAKRNTNHGNYSGTAFVDGFFNSTTAQVAFTINAPSAGIYSLSLRYSAGNGTSTNTDLYVNGLKVKDLTFNATSNWDTWSNGMVSVSLKAGSNTVAYKADSSNRNCINLDKLTVSSIPGKANGATCSSAGECLSGNCVEGVCCNSSCGGIGICRTCRASGSVGTCTNYSSATVCSPSYCSNGVLTKASTCDGAGTCKAGTQMSCGPYICANSSACKSSCTTNADCASGKSCKGGVCTASKANGATCSSAGECLSGNCVEGVCCNSSCGGISICRTCRASGSVGTCTNYSSATVCSPSYCSNGVLTKASTCDGAGTCKTGTQTSCGPYICASSSACKSSCSTNADCASGNSCKNGVCIPKKMNGATCSTAGECFSGICKGGICTAS